MSEPPDVQRGAPGSQRGAPGSQRGAPGSQRGAPGSQRGAPGSQRGASNAGAPAVRKTGRQRRLESHEREEMWKNPPLKIDMDICINCDACFRACPKPFGAIFNHDIDVIIIPELCSGCNKCIDPCPVDCIYPDPNWNPAPDEWWEEPATHDPYVS